MSFPTLHTGANWTVQMVQGQTQTQAPDSFINVALKRVTSFLKGLKRVRAVH